MYGDISVHGPNAVLKRYLASGQTSILAGEPVHQVSPARTAGASSTNAWVLAAVDTPIVSTHAFGGVAVKNSLNAAAGTTNAQYLPCACPAPYVGILRGRAQTVGNIDTAAELVLVLGDFTLIDYSATGATDGGQLYTIIETATADTSGLEIIGGNPTLGTLDAVIDARAYRFEVS